MKVVSKIEERGNRNDNGLRFIFFFLATFSASLFSVVSSSFSLFFFPTLYFNSIIFVAFYLYYNIPTIDIFVYKNLSNF